MIQISVTVSRGENFTPASLMYRYAKHTPGVTHYNSHFGATRLIIKGKHYEYHHLSITAENGTDVVTLHLEEVKSNERV